MFVVLLAIFLNCCIAQRSNLRPRVRNQGIVSRPSRNQVVPDPRRTDPRNFKNGTYIRSVATVDKPFLMSTSRGPRWFTYKKNSKGKRYAVEIKALSPIKADGGDRTTTRSMQVDKQTASVRRVVLFDVMFEGRGCGRSNDRKPCEPSCGANTIMSLFDNGDRSVNSLFTKMSRGVASFQTSTDRIFSVTLPENTPLHDIPSVIETKLGNQPGESFVYILPKNYEREEFVSAAGLGQQPGKVIWIKDCGSSALAHELGHNWGFGHASSRNNGQLVEYGDSSSVMSTASDSSRKGWGFGVGALRGAGAPQLKQLGWLPPGSIQDITADGPYSLPNSLSSNADGVVCARVFTAPKKRPIWLEWREAKNQDVSFGDSRFDEFSKRSRVDNRLGPFLGSLLVKEFVGTNSVLLAVIPPGQKAKVNGVTVEVGAAPSSFSISGIGSDDAINFDAPLPPSYRANQDFSTSAAGDLFQVRKGELLVVVESIQSSDPAWFFANNEKGVLGPYMFAWATRET